jgi:hypothetical protein
MSLLLAILFPRVVKSKAHWFIAFFLALDVLVNYTEVTVAFLQFPRKGDWTVTKRLRSLKGDTTWRGRMAAGISEWLNKVDPGHV